MKMVISSIWVLYKSFFDTVPGQKGLLGIGLSLMAFGYFQNQSSHAELFVMAGTAFVVGFTLLFAGPHFRQLVSFRRHRLLPDFSKHLIISYLLALASLSLFLFLGLTLLDTQNPVQRLESVGIPVGIIWLSTLSIVLITSLSGFLPGYLRYPAWLLIIICVVNIHHFLAAPIEWLLFSVIGVAVVALCCFIYFMGVTNKPTLYTKKAVSLSKYLPGLNGDFQQPGVTAVGSILLGMSDGIRSRFFRAFFTAFLLPVALACSALLAGRYSTEQVFQNPLIILMGLILGVMIQIHFAFTVSARRRFIRLRVGDNRQQIDQVAQRVLAKERWFMAFCFGLWCVPVVALFPKTAAWLLGVSTLLWIMMLFLEKIILTLNGQLTRRVEFYMLLIFVGVVVCIVALAQVHQQPEMLWAGVAAIFSSYAVLIYVK